MRMEQNFGPHIEQKCATFGGLPSAASHVEGAGRVRVEREVDWS